jgi:N-acetyl-gamma-glutamyl-phosphate reductase
MNKIKVGIIGGAGYTGGELIRLLIHHPYVSISFVHSRSNAGKAIHSVHHDLIGETQLAFSSDFDHEADLVFLCLAHGEAKSFLENNRLSDKAKMIDLSNDFRLHSNSRFQNKIFVYGLPELNKDEVTQASHVANPGCFATAIQLGLLPLAKAGMLTEIFTTGITGSTGAGQTLSATSHFSWRSNNIQAYKTLTHQHLNEIVQSLNQLQTKSPLSLDNVNFVPWRGDFTRGIFISSTVSSNMSIQELQELYMNFYKDAAFTYVSQEPISLKQVVNTNKCLIQLEKHGSKLVVHSVIDNLLKGASGQAVQNMNLMFGFEERAGLNLKANFF